MGNLKSTETKNDVPVYLTDYNSSGCNECGSESFNVEIADELRYDNYSKGVTFTTFGDKVKLNYDGTLLKNGASEVFAVVGCSDSKSGQNTLTYPMNNTTQQMFELSIPAKKGDELSVSFKDNANNWDNNSGKNYRYYIQ